MIEVEIKFSLSDGNEERVIEGADFIGTKENNDAYFDDEIFSLTLKDWWLRKRNDKFELKLPPESDTQNIQYQARRYEELVEDTDIIKALQFSGDDVASVLADNNLSPFAELITIRSSYRQGKFRIDIDRTKASSQNNIPISRPLCINLRLFLNHETLTVAKLRLLFRSIRKVASRRILNEICPCYFAMVPNFDYDIGEIELLVEDVKDIEAAEKELVKFLVERDVSNADNELGKVAYYLQKNRREHFDRLVEAGVIDDITRAN